jgi:predicted ribosomally synthesized peptide with nif11-like leader
LVKLGSVSPLLVKLAFQWIDLIVFYGENIMSLQIAQDFIIKVQSDEKLRSDVIGLGQDYDALVQLAAKNGYTFTVEDLQAAAQASGYKTGQAINEADLSQVAGGGVLPRLPGQTVDTQWTQNSGCC